VNYDEWPTRGKETSEDEKMRNCICGGRTYTSYRENRLYVVLCEKCGERNKFRTSSMDEAIKLWNSYRKYMR